MKKGKDHVASLTLSSTMDETMGLFNWRFQSLKLSTTPRKRR